MAGARNCYEVTELDGFCGANADVAKRRRAKLLVNVAQGELILIQQGNTPS